MSLRVRLRRALNLDGPWVCLGCGLVAVVKETSGELRCVGCGKGQCSCELGGWDGTGWRDPACAHHGAELLRVLKIEERAEAIVANRA